MNWLKLLKLKIEIDELLTANQAERALTKLREAIALNPDLPISVDNWNRICWRGSLDGKAALVLSAYDEAVSLDPEAIAAFVVVEAEPERLRGIVEGQCSVVRSPTPQFLSIHLLKKIL